MRDFPSDSPLFSSFALAFGECAAREVRKHGFRHRADLILTQRAIGKVVELLTSTLPGIFPRDGDIDELILTLDGDYLPEHPDGFAVALIHLYTRTSCFLSVMNRHGIAEDAYGKWVCDVDLFSHITEMPAVLAEALEAQIGDESSPDTSKPYPFGEK